MLLCYQFRDRKNAGDPTAADLLGPAPVVPATPVSPEEADRLQTEFFLRQDLRLVGVAWDAQPRKPVLYTHGNVAAPTLPVQTGAGVETAQRTMANPDLVVEVRGGASMASPLDCICEALPARGERVSTKPRARALGWFLPLASLSRLC